MLFPRQSSTREVIEIGGLWDFAKDKEDIGVRERWFARPPHTRPMAVGANYNEQTADDELWEFFGKVWYFKRFIVPSSWSGKRIVLRIGAANYSSRVWLDGRPLMANEGGALPFEAEVTRRVAPGEEHFLAVRVDSTLSYTTIPPAVMVPEKGRPLEYEFDFLHMSGIHRPVRLYATAKTYLDDITVTPWIDGRAGGFDVNWRVAGAHDSVRFAVLDHKRRAVTSVETSKSSCRLTIPKCRLWSPEDPYLYTLRTEVLNDAHMVDEYPLPVGVRTVKVRGTEFLLNGKPVYFKGASRHEDFPVIGRGPNDAVLVKDFSLMKWVNANFFRTVHYPYAEEVLNMADQLGIMVINETPAVGMNGKGRRIFRKGFLDERTRKTHIALLERQYERDKNHPSIVMWSLANEPSSWDPGFVPYIRPVFKRMRELDRTRPVSFVTDAGCRGEKAGRFCDVILTNIYIGWYERTGQLGAIEEDLSRELDGWRARFAKPVIVTEFGCDTIAGMHSEPPLMFSEEYQVEFMKHYAKVLDSKPFVIGEAVWVMNDFLTKQGLTRCGGNRKGIFTRLREPKMAAHWLKSRWAKK